MDTVELWIAASWLVASVDHRNVDSPHRWITATWTRLIAGSSQRGLASSLDHRNVDSPHRWIIATVCIGIFFALLLLADYPLVTYPSLIPLL